MFSLFFVKKKFWAVAITKKDTFTIQTRNVQDFFFSTNYSWVRSAFGAVLDNHGFCALRRTAARVFAQTTLLCTFPRFSKVNWKNLSENKSNEKCVNVEKTMKCYFLLFVPLLLNHFKVFVIIVIGDIFPLKRIRQLMCRLRER